MAKKPFDRLGVMIDMSRNAVMTVEGLKRLLPLLAKMGYNCAMLYTEDTYEVEGEPYFGYMRGRYSVEEMCELDRFAASVGIELIPCIQTLAHLNAFLRWYRVPKDCNDILLTDDERTYELIDHMLKTLSQCFHSRLIHIGMDEAGMLGRGKHLDLHGYEPASEVIRRHLSRVCELTRKYDYQPLVWSDMFFRPWNGGNYFSWKTTIPQEFVDAVPADVSPVYWDYYHNKEEEYDAMLSNHRQLSDRTWFGGGAWCWTGIVPHNQASIDYMTPAIRACHKNGVRNIFFTMWGDDGAECDHFAQLPCLLYLAEYARGNTDEASIKAKFQRLTGMSYDDFMTLDLPNRLPSHDSFPNPSKYMLYSDYFNDFLDYTVCPGAGERYVEYAARLTEVAKKSRKYGYLFDTEAKLCDVLAIKYELGCRTRAAYARGDKEELRRLANEDYREVTRRLRRFHAAFEKQWFRTNKPCGFDVQDIRIGALLQRTDSCRRRLLDYAGGRIDSIPELQEQLLPFGEAGMAMRVNSFLLYGTTNVLSHGY